MAPHILQCRVRQTEEKFYFECAVWIDCDREWEAHCSAHLKKLNDPFCGSRRFYKLAILVPLCPFCHGNSNLRPETQYRQFPTTVGRDGYRNHLLQHLRGLEGLEEVEGSAITCPHPLFKKEGFESISHLRGHLISKLHDIATSCVWG
jgi:hypothetical protein